LFEANVLKKAYFVCSVHQKLDVLDVIYLFATPWLNSIIVSILV